ncbi:hypothetical protein GNI_013780 [Gregarina niphandrodes]|uniref:Uncharacterized protein n=1 Tax=Gregarina niphandrodes TaxID=110365 RepID=A0A023BCL6_GRENI|nr:hypothetical protein GNI_013780 [Gregarina niphandrodes]EZG83895.1 hypothetical protein GNI_013780 [Gregarina niphandrodes]|eukprot:XP_011128894.1 hypothetical protein GNI_013780 [Gregarina niphandrodes]
MRTDNEYKAGPQTCEFKLEMRALKARISSGMVGMLALLMPGGGWRYPECGAGVRVGRRAGLIWRHTMARRSLIDGWESKEEMLNCVRWFIGSIYPEPGVGRRTIWYNDRGLPVYMAQSVEDYEQWCAVKNNEILSWLLPQERAEWMSPLDLSARVDMPAQTDILRHMFDLYTEDFGQLSVEATASPEPFTPKKGNCRSIPGLILWAGFRYDAPYMCLRDRWERLAVLSRWYPEEACEAVLKDLEQLTDLPARLMPSLFVPTALTAAPREPPVAVSKQQLNDTASLWWFDPQNEDSPLDINQNRRRRRLNPPTPRIVEEIAADVRNFVKALQKQLRQTDADKSQATPRPPGGQVACADEIRYWMKKVAIRRKAMLKERYKVAYTGCKEYVEAAYFSDESSGTVRFPVACPGWMRPLSRLRNYELRQRACFEEELVLALIHGCIRLEAVESGHHCSSLVAELDDAVHEEDCPEFTVSTGQLACLYEWHLDDVIERVATDQARDYACRVGGAIATLLWDLTGGDPADGEDLAAENLTSAEADGLLPSKRRKRE